MNQDRTGEISDDVRNAIGEPIASSQWANDFLGFIGGMLGCGSIVGSAICAIAIYSAVTNFTAVNAQIPWLVLKRPTVAGFEAPRDIQRQVDANAVGSTMPSLNNSVMERLQFTFPPVSEQREIARRISAIDSSIRIEDERRSKAQLTKSGLMQDLLTGRVRVKVYEAKEADQ